MVTTQPTPTQISTNHNTRVSLIQSINNSKTLVVIALTGGGQVIGDLLSVPGTSGTLLEATITYSPESLRDYIGFTPDQYCCRQTACYLATAAFNRIIKIIRTRKNIYSSCLKFPEAEYASATTWNGCSGAKPAAHTGFGISTTLCPYDVADQLDNADFHPQKSNQQDQTTLKDFSNLISVGCTASLVTNREKSGEHRVHVAVQTLKSTFAFSLKLRKGERTRDEEDRLVADLILNAIDIARNDLTDNSDTDFDYNNMSSNELFNAFEYSSSEDSEFGVSLPLELKAGEFVESVSVVCTPPLVDLFFGKSKAVMWHDGKIRYFCRNSTEDNLNSSKQNARSRQRETVVQERNLPSVPVAVSALGDVNSDTFNQYAEFMQAIFPGSFNPVHSGHIGMIEVAERRLGCRVAMEISISNADKPMIDYIALWFRLNEIARVRSGQIVWLTQTPLFEDKSELFRGATFIVGADTLRRFADVGQYYKNIHHLHDVLRVMAYHDCRFLVFAREHESVVESLSSLNIPDMLRSLCDEVSESEFKKNISSTNLRRNKITDGNF
ncbi:MAG: hypothetical protein LBJ00_03435 [Planctomycetaceae bacterium]|jgi:nicotinic acid mononucleotide adenylyltransferase|nr:hypothetical protein [Planctomycetaceae bacterium]